MRPHKYFQKMTRNKIQFINTRSDPYLWGANLVLDINKIAIKLEYLISRILCNCKIQRLNLKLEYEILARRNLCDYNFVQNIISEPDVLLATHTYGELKNFANNAKIRSFLKFLLILYALLCGLTRTVILSPGSFYSSSLVLSNCDYMY